MKQVRVIGMGVGRADLASRHREAIDAADILVGAKRHLALFDGYPGRKVEIKAPVSDVIDQIRGAMQDHRVVVLATGDPLFYGIGTTLAETLGEENVEILPNVSVMAEAFARIGKSWADAVVVSLHGRDGESGLCAALGGFRPVFVFTDRRHTPAYAAEMAAGHAPGRWRVCVVSRLGEADERVEWLVPEAAAGRTFSEPNAVILWPEAERRCRPGLGGPDEDYAHDRGMITKAEVRAVSIAKLRLEPGSVMWDLGAGSGAVAVEASIFVTGGRIEAVEKNADRVKNIRQNIEKFGVSNMFVHEMQLPSGMDALPDPDRIFVGGGGEALPEILNTAVKRLQPGGRIVINAVVIETVTACLDILNAEDFETELVQVQVSKGARMPAGMRLSAGNPVFVLSARKSKDF
ncbi:MAG: precorrin-6y C5,15-methyltransferase (decarboxylating) subunit CbiE [Desulfobacterales bacterium]|nr:precorrin-6y C5,15-methyltransferase (decarboxylating) subunit CbiE [Desulfobacterales bacterium]